MAREREAERWLQEASQHLPPGVAAEGAVSGGAGLSHPALFSLLAAFFLFEVALASWLVRVSGQPAVPLMLGGMIALYLAVQALSPLGIYRSILISWSPGQIWVIERGAFNRLLGVRSYPRPLNARWEGRGTVRFAGERVHMDDPGLCRPLLSRALAGEETGVVPAARAAGLRAINPLTLAGIAWFSVSFLGMSGLSGLGGELPGTLRMPLSGPGEVAVDGQGRVAVALEPLERIQVYSPGGSFLFGVSVPPVRGPSGSPQTRLGDGGPPPLRGSTDGRRRGPSRARGRWSGPSRRFGSPRASGTEVGM